MVTVTKWRCTAATAMSLLLSCSPGFSQAHQGGNDVSAEDGAPAGLLCLPRSLSWLRSRSNVATRAARVSRSACSDASSERRRSCGGREGWGGAQGVRASKTTSRRAAQRGVHTSASKRDDRSAASVADNWFRARL